MYTKFKTEFLQTKTFISNYFTLQDKKRSTIQFLCSRSQHFQLVHHLPIFFNSHPELPMQNSLPTDVNCSNKNRASPFFSHRPLSETKSPTSRVQQQNNLGTEGGNVKAPQRQLKRKFGSYDWSF